MQSKLLLLAPLLAAIKPIFAQEQEQQQLAQQSGPPQLFEPALVSKYTESLLSEFSQYTSYDGLSPSAAKSASAAAAASPTPTADTSRASADSCDWWMADIKHQGLAAYNPNPNNYQVFRNVKDYGATGDGNTDDTAAINAAISAGGRCAPGSCSSSTNTPAVVYFPPGVYRVSGPVITYYYTMLTGNPNCLPTIKATAGFASTPGSIGIIDGDPYSTTTGQLEYGATNVFWRQIRNFIVDMTDIPATSAATGIHWPTGQATSIQNVRFEMNVDRNSQQQGIFIESGSGGFMNDLTFNGGLYGLNVGNQQFTMRNMNFNNVEVAISQIWNWGWAYYGIKINNCQVGYSMNGGSPDQLSVGSVTFFDSQITNTPTFIRAGYTANSDPPAANSIILENIDLENVPIAVKDGNGNTVLEGSTGTKKIDGWGHGHSYKPDGPRRFQGAIKPASRPAGLTNADGSYYQRSKPQYNKLGLSSFISARDQGATGDGRTDDTKALQKAIDNAAAQDKILFVDHGNYLVSRSIYIPPKARIVGEAFSVIMSYGKFFNDMKNPKPVVQIGRPGDQGRIEWSDMVVSTKGQQRGAILFEYNIRSPANFPTAVWDVHARIGGFAGSDLSLADCPKTPDIEITSDNLDENCISGFLTVHITKGASGLYLENNWIWVADHDLEDRQLRQITIYAGRGLLDESTRGNIWLVGGAVEHHVKYEYVFANTQNVFAGHIQVETAYYQPNPQANIPFPRRTDYFDPTFPRDTIEDNGKEIPAANGHGVRITNSNNVAIYGAGLYSFFNNYSTECSNEGNDEGCQDRMLYLHGDNSYITVYNENTVGTHYMATVNGDDVAYYADNLDGFVDTIALFRLEASSNPKKPPKQPKPPQDPKKPQEPEDPHELCGCD